MNPEKFYSQEQNHIADDKENTFEIGVEQTPQREITRGLKESQISYLHRTGELVTQKIIEKEGFCFDPFRVQENDLPEDARNMIKTIMAEALKQQEDVVDPQKNEKIIKNIEEAVSYHDKGNLTDSSSFDTTQRNRKFFDIQPSMGSAKRETYWNTLFFPYYTEAIQAFAQKTLDDKKIVLLGGGRSRLKEELREHNITPREIVNIDPFVENIKKGADLVISLSASDENLVKKMRDQGIENADEIWAEYSVPAYLEDPKEIQQLIQNIDALLAVGGNARIWPIEVGGRGADIDKLARKNALIESLKNISAINKYEMLIYKAAGREGFILHKLTPLKEELQKIKD